MLEYGIDYVVGESTLPSHFRKPRYPIAYAKHSVIFRNGAHLQLVSSDQPESVAGRNAVHAFVEEMKHNSGEKLKTRLFHLCVEVQPMCDVLLTMKVLPA